MTKQKKQSTARSPSRRTWLILWLLAGFVTVLNAVKPLHIDDPFLLRVAEQIREHPLDPYGFDIFWYQWPQPVYEELTPPVLPYWWSMGLALFGDQPLLWKLWLYPFSLLFCVSVFLLLRWTARGVELPLTIMTALSPVFLPSLNLMQDIPAQGLGLSALVLYLRSAARRSWPTAVAAGFVAGLATQTKYTTVTLLGAMLLHGALYGRLRLASLATALALSLFAAWELFVTSQYGRGMFLGQVGSNLDWAPRLYMVPPMLHDLGGTLPALMLTGAAALGLRGRFVAVAAVGVLAGYGLMLQRPVAGWFYPLLGMGFVLVLGAACWRLGVRRGGSPGWQWRFRGGPLNLFLLCWLGLELVGYFAMAPFPAVRRVIGLSLVSTLILGRMAALARRAHGRSVPLAALVVLGAVLGLVFYGTDLREAQAHRRAAEGASQQIRARDPDATIWFTGHWGFQFYAERSGMQALVPDHTLVRAGDWLVVPDSSRLDRQEVLILMKDFERLDSWAADDFFPLLTSYGFYGGTAPLEHRGGSQTSLRIYRARRDQIPASAWSIQRTVGYARSAWERSALWTLPALVRGLGHHPDADARRECAIALGGMGDRARDAAGSLRKALEDPDPGVRKAAGRALDQVSR